MLPEATGSVLTAGVDFGGTKGGRTGAGGTGKSTSEDFGLVGEVLGAPVLVGVAAGVFAGAGSGTTTTALGAGDSVLTGFFGFAGSCTALAAGLAGFASTLAAGFTAGSGFAGDAAFLVGLSALALGKGVDFFGRGDCFKGVDFFNGGDFSEGVFFFTGAIFLAVAGILGCVAFLTGAAFFATLRSGFFAAGAGFDGLTVVFACPFLGAALGVVFFAAMTQSGGAGVENIL